MQERPPVLGIITQVDEDSHVKKAEDSWRARLADRAPIAAAEFGSHKHHHLYRHLSTNARCTASAPHMSCSPLWVQINIALRSSLAYGGLKILAAGARTLVSQSASRRTASPRHQGSRRSATRDLHHLEVPDTRGHKTPPPIRPPLARIPPLNRA